MDNDKPEPPLDLGVHGKPVRRRFELPDIVAVAASILWIALVAGFWYLMGLPPEEGAPGFDPQTFVMTLVSILLPIGLIWVAAAGVKTARIMREEAERLQASIDAMRHAYVQQARAMQQGAPPELERKLDEIVQSQKQTETAIATFTSRREPADEPPSEQKVALPRTPPEQPADQPALALDAPPDEPPEPISIAEFIRALNFPENEDDAEGFRVLRRALADRDIGKMIRASQDVLTLLSQDGIYMDDLRPDRPRAETWRKFAHGERGPAVAGLGGIRDRSCLALAAGRMKSDPVFRDAVHHFLRQFDRVLIEFEQNATDRELLEMGDTRTARAFMLLGRIAGTFD